MPGLVAWLVGAALSAGGCASAPPVPPEPVITAETKMGWILRLEDTRILHDPLPPAVEPPLEPQKPEVPSPATPLVRADLVRLLDDPDPQIRRRAALAVGRVGLPEGVTPLLAALSDPEAGVRQVAAFALGLLGDRAAADPLLQALAADSSATVRGRAAEALGRLGDPAVAPAIGRMVTEYVQQGVLGPMTADDETYPAEAPVEAIRLGVFALARLDAYEPLASAVLGSDGLPVTRWWPITYALQRVGDPRALTILMHLAGGAGTYTAALAARGLGELRDPAATRVLIPLLDASRHRPAVVVAAIRALAQLGADDPEPLMALLTEPGLDPNVRVEVIEALGTLEAVPAVPAIMDFVADPWPPLRAAALRALARIDRESFVLVLSSLEPDQHWSVRAAVATALGELEYETAAPRLNQLLADEDRRVIPAVLATLSRLDAPSTDATLLKFLGDADPAVRAAAAREIARRRPAGAPPALAEAYGVAAADPTYTVRAAVLEALAAYGRAPAEPLLVDALSDRDWAVRVRAAELLATLDPSSAAPERIRPVPGGPPPGVEAYDDQSLLAPTYSPQLYIETARGTIQIELAVLDAPVTTRALASLARGGFFTGLSVHRVVPGVVVQMGDPRGDGEGGPGFTLRDEISPRPFLRGTVGMALDWADTGSSQFFICQTPQPHLDGRYTVIGTVVDGMDVVDRLQRWDTIRRITIWDGVTLSDW